MKAAEVPQTPATLSAVSSAVCGSHVLVTGGTGSFGRHVAAQLTARGARRVSIFSRDEKKQHDMRRLHPGFRYVLGDVRDADAVEDAMVDVDIVFHAAALKQVPNCEAWPMEAVATNVLGSNNVFRAAHRARVRAVVALSTDKAVKPVNAMGMTKALMEKLVGQFSSLPGETRFSCVRYGNVLGSRGSVLPLFRAQIERGEPITLTVPHMTRFLLTLDQAVGLVFHAMEHARTGDVLVHKAPACRVDLLADAAQRVFGGGRTARREVVGMRIGEKVHEVLINEYEMLRAEERDGFFVIAREASCPLPTTSTSYPEYTSETARQITELDELAALVEGAALGMEAN
jgi:FlaA1/EpsC-like NDP-sugar epimerase